MLSVGTIVMTGRSLGIVCGDETTSPEGDDYYPVWNGCNDVLLKNKDGSYTVERVSSVTRIMNEDRYVILGRISSFDGLPPWETKPVVRQYP